MTATMTDLAALRGSAASKVEAPAEAVDLTIGIVNYRSLDLLVQCLPTIAAATQGLRIELVVVENGTGEDIETVVPDLVEAARCLVLPTPIPFAAAVNRALLHGRGRHLALLNPDTLLFPGSLTALVRHLDAEPKVGIVGPRVWDDMERRSLQRSFRSWPGPATALFHRYSLLTRLWPGNPWSRRYLNLDRDSDRTQAIDWVSGCCMVIRGDLFRAVGGLDERFPMFFEDVDLCRTITDRGHQVHYVPAAEIVHLVGGSRRRAALRSVWLRHRSMARYLLKHHGRGSPLTWLMICVVLCRFLWQAPQARRLP